MWFNWFKKKEKEIKPLLVIEPEQPKWYRFVKSFNPYEIATHVKAGGCYRLKNKSKGYTAPTYIQVIGERGELSSFINIKCFEELSLEHAQILEMSYNLENGKTNNNY